MVSIGISSALFGITFGALGQDPVRGIIAGAMFGAGFSMAPRKGLAFIHGVLAAAVEGLIYIIVEILNAANIGSGTGIEQPNGARLAADILYAFAEGVYDSMVSQIIDVFQFDKLAAGMQLMMDLAKNIIDQMAARRDWSETPVSQFMSALVDFVFTLATSSAVGLWPRAVERRLERLSYALNPISYGSSGALGNSGSSLRALGAERFSTLFEPMLTRIFTQLGQVASRFGFGAFGQ
jgi:hypothetical protein